MSAAQGDSATDSSENNALFDFGKYVIVRRLGSGSFGETFLAEDTSRSNYPVVIKVPRAPDGGAIGDASYRALSSIGAPQFLESEAWILSQLNNPRIISYLDFVETHDKWFLVMAYAAGGSLADKLKHPTRIPAHIARVLLHLLQGLEIIHLRGFMHLDIK